MIKNIRTRCSRSRLRRTLREMNTRIEMTIRCLAQGVWRTTMRLEVRTRRVCFLRCVIASRATRRVSMGTLGACSVSMKFWWTRMMSINRSFLMKKWCSGCGRMIISSNPLVHCSIQPNTCKTKCRSSSALGKRWSLRRKQRGCMSCCRVARPTHQSLITNWVIIWWISLALMLTISHASFPLQPTCTIGQAVAIWGRWKSRNWAVRLSSVTRNKMTASWTRMRIMKSIFSKIKERMNSTSK